jgi:predicted secreted hydrolase
MMSTVLRSAAHRLARRVWRGALETGDAASDDRPHATPLEWWYLIGWLDIEGEARGIELTCARSADPLTGRLAGWAAAHAQVTADAYRVEERTRMGDGGLRDAPGQLEINFPGAPPWSLMTLPGTGEWRARCGLDDGALDLILTATRPPARWGERGVVDYGGRERLAWTSWSRLEVRGALGRDRLVTGHAWIDRQWGAAWVDGYRWTVVLVQLDDGRDLMAFHMTDRQGRFVHAYAGEHRADGGTRHLPPAAVRLEPQGPMLRSHGRTFRPGTRLRLAAWGVDLTLQPWRLDQHKRTGRRAQAFPDWWEGACAVEGVVEGAPVSGRAFVEISGG